MLCNTCHKIHSSLCKNCKDKLFNVAVRIKRKETEERCQFSRQMIVVTIQRTFRPQSSNNFSKKTFFLLYLAWKALVIFYLALKDKNPYFFSGEPHRVFHHRFSGAFIFLPLFFRCFRFFHHCFSGAFMSPTFFTLLLYCEGYGFERAFFTLRCFLSYTPSHICHGTTSATDQGELFLTLRRFYITLLPDIWPNLLLSRLPWELAFLPWR